MCIQNLAKVKQIEDTIASDQWADLSEQDKEDVSFLLLIMYQYKCDHFIVSHQEPP